MLQNSGYPTRAQHVESEEGLVKLLQDQQWDLAIGLDTTTNVTPGTVVKQIRRLSKDIPLILLTDDEGSKPLVDGLKGGAVDVVRLDEDQHLLLVIARELNNRENRSQQRIAERRFKEIARRNQQLLESSKDGIAFIQDGMFLYANPSFADALGYKDADEIECMPVIDIIHEKDQERVKEFIKEFMIRSSDVETQKITIDAIGGDGPPRTLNIDVRKAQYEEELCIQFVVKFIGGVNNVHLEAKLEQIRHQDLATGLYNKNRLIEELEVTVDDAVKNTTTSALMCIQLNNFMDTVQSKVGLAAADIVLGTVADYAKTLVKENELLCRFNEDSFMLLSRNISPDEALKRADTLAHTLGKRIVDIDDDTLQFVYHIGVSLINETTSNSDTPIGNAVKALELLAEKAKTDATVLSCIYEEPETADEEAARSTKETAKMVQHALDQGRFRLLFQPILSLRGSDREHYEVLLRIIDENGNGISPDEFLGVAAKFDMTTKIDRWVILESIKVLSKHRKEGHSTRIIINLSRESVKDASLPPWLGVAFKAAKLPPDAIVFQFSEVVANDHLNVAKAFTEQVTALGAECCISHFGCALNPFNALELLKAQYIKVDGSFTRELQSASGEPAALNELVAQLHEHEKITIVPFVENASVLSKLWQSGVHYIQGYYLQGPAESMDYDFDTES